MVLCQPCDKLPDAPWLTVLGFWGWAMVVGWGAIPLVLGISVCLQFGSHYLTRA